MSTQKRENPDTTIFMEKIVIKAEAKSVFDLSLNKAAEARLDAEAEIEIDAGKGVPHEQGRKWLLKIAEGEKLPPPIG